MSNPQMNTLPDDLQRQIADLRTAGVSIGSSEPGNRPRRTRCFGDRALDPVLPHHV